MKRIVTYKTAFIAFCLVFAAMVVTSDTPQCAASASHTAPYDYCFETRVSITNSGATDLTNQPVRVLMPASGLINSGKLDPRGWDLFPVVGDLANEIDVQQQSLSSSQAPYWMVIPDLPAGSTRDVALYSGNNEVRVDHGIYFTGNEYLTVADNATLSVNDQLAVEVLFRPLTAPTSNQIIAEHRDGAAGWRVQYTSGPDELLFALDGANCSIAWDSAWTDEKALYRFEYDSTAGPTDAHIYRNGSLIKACLLNEGTIGDPATDLVIGAIDSTFTAKLENTVVYSVEVLENDVTAGYWGFDANQTQETNSTNPYLGTTEDYSGNGFTANYTFDRDQSDLSFTVGTTHLITLTPHIADPDSTNRVVGLAVPDDFSSVRPKQTTGIGYTLFVSRLEDVASATGAPADAVIAATFTIVSLILAALVWRLTGGFMPAAVLTLGIGPSLAVAMGYVEYWWLFIWGLTVAVTWLAQLRSQQSS